MPRRRAGQVVAWYRDGECLGSAPILAPGPSLFELQRQRGGLECYPGPNQIIDPFRMNSF